MATTTFTTHLLTRAFCSAVAREYTASRTIRLKIAPFPGLTIFFGKPPAFRVRNVQLNHDDGSFTLLEERSGHFTATVAAIDEWAATWRSVGFTVDELTPDKPPPPPYLRLIT